MMHLDLEEAPRLFRKRWLWSAERPAFSWLRRGDHMGDPERPLAESVRDLVAKETGRFAKGPVSLLTQLRTLGHGFNPVSFYFVYEEDGKRLQAVVAEVNNTPWREQHCYVLPCEDGYADAWTFRLRKNFHVSPFMPMDVEYTWSFTRPGNDLGVTMTSSRKGGDFFSATLNLKRREITGSSLARVLLRFPLMTLRIIVAIHWQALRLWLKGAAFHVHPAKEASHAANTP